MKTMFKVIILIALSLLFCACQNENEELIGNDAVTDTFVLVDYYAGAYKFVQINNEYTIGVVDGLVNIPKDFHLYESEEVHSYFKVDLLLTGIENENSSIKYLRYTGETQYYQVKQIGEYSLYDCCVQRIPFYKDYMYVLMEKR